VGEAKRRKTARDKLQEAFDEAHAEGHGIWDLRAYEFSSIPDVLAMAAEGHREADELAETLYSVIMQIARPDTDIGQAPLCLMCDQTFTKTNDRPAMFTVLKGANPNGRTRIVSLVCKSCAQKPDLRQRIFDTIKHGAIQDAREIHLAEPGHA
jgi:hypothetical protein